MMNTLAIVPLAVACQAASTTSDADLTFVVQPMSAYVAGLPMPLEVLVEGAGDCVAIDVLRDFNPLEIRLRSAANEYRVHTKLTEDVRGIPAYEPHLQIRTIPVPRVSIPPGTKNQFVLDLSNLEINVRISHGTRSVTRPDTLVPATYELALNSAAIEAEVRVEGGPILVVAPNAEEQRFLERLYALPRGRAVWHSFVEHAEQVLDGIQLDGFSELGRRQLQYALLLARLVHSDVAIGDLTILQADTENLLTVYQTDVLILRYEIELAAGRILDAEALRELILLSRPAAKNRLDTMEERGGMIAQLREAVRARR